MKRYFEHWTQVLCYPEVDGSCDTDGGRAYLKLNDNRYSFVKLVSEILEIMPETVYRFDLAMRAEEGVSVRISYRIFDAVGLQIYYSGLGKHVRFFTPEAGRRIELIVMINSYTGGTAQIDGCSLEPVCETAPRKVKLAAVSGAYPGEAYRGLFEHTIEKNTEHAARMLDAAAKEGAQLVLFPEYYNFLGVKGVNGYTGAVRMDDPAVRVYADKAREHHMFVVPCLNIIEDGLLHESQLIFDPLGHMIGQYSKVHLTDGDLCSGSVPGKEIPVFDTEIGKLGCSICWDLYFPEHARVSYMKGAEILLNSTDSTNPLQLPDTAESDAMFIVVAQGCKRVGDIVKTRIISRGGRELNHATTEKPFAIAEIDLTEDHSFFWAKGDQKALCLASRRPELYGTLTDGTTGFEDEYSVGCFKAD